MTAFYAQPLSLDAGADYTLKVPFPLYQEDGVTPLNLATYTAKLMLRVTHRDRRAQVALTSSASAQGQVFLSLPAVPNGVPSTANGLVGFTITQAAIASFLDRAGIWDLFIYTNAVPPVATKVASGTWALDNSATQGA
jgi:hypothetical protein